MVGFPMITGIFCGDLIDTFVEIGGMHKVSQGFSADDGGGGSRNRVTGAPSFDRPSRE
jgi:hypothetical protein